MLLVPKFHPLSCDHTRRGERAVSLLSRVLSFPPLFLGWPSFRGGYSFPLMARKRLFGIDVTPRLHSIIIANLERVLPNLLPYFFSRRFHDFWD